MRPKRLKLRAFIEGVEVPAVSAVVNIQPNSPATASVQIVPGEVGTEIYPRSLVHLFYRDFTEGPGDNIYVSTSGETKSLGFSPAEAEKHRYKLFFVGETAGVAYSKSTHSRSMVLQCMDLSEYWDSCRYYKKGWGYKNQFYGGAYKTLTDWFTSTGELVYEKLTTPPVGYKNITGLVGGIIHILQAVGGVYRNDVKFRGTNVFFSLAELRLRLSSLIAAPEDDTPKKLMSYSGFGQIWNKSIKGLGREFTFRRAILALMRYIFYEVYPNPCSMLIPSDSSSIEDPQEMRIADHPRWKHVTNDIRKMSDSISEMISDVETAEEYSDFDRKVKMGEMISGLQSMEKSLLATAESLRSEANTTSAPVKKNGLMKVRGKVLAAQKKIKEARGACRAGKKYLSKLPGIGSKSTKITKALDKADGSLREVLGLTLKGKRGSSLVEPPRLANQLFRPDAWFASPPRCNVIFPDQYTSISYGRRYADEITRLLLRTSDAYTGGDIMWDNFYYAPHAEGMLKGKDLVHKNAVEVGLAYLVANRDIMDHELFTGIIPHFERAKGLQVYGVRSGKVVAGDKKTRVDYAQRLVNFLFFKYRYSARVTSIKGAFNPYLVPGFPALLIDKYIDQITAEKVTNVLSVNSGDIESIRGMTGRHFLGTITGLSHTLSQDAAWTDITLGYTRSHREHIDPIGADKVTAKKIKGNKKKTYTVCALSDMPPQAGKDHGLFGGVVISTVVSPGDTSTHPLWNSPAGRKKGKVLTYVQGNTEKKAASHGVEVVTLVGDPSVSVTFSVYTVTEITQKSEKKVIDMPFEDIVRPSWYGDVWTNRMIGGAVYQPMIGTGAITDPIVIKDQERTYSLADSDTVTQVSNEYNSSSEDKAFSTVVSDLDDDATIENAIDFLVYTYSQIVTNGYDIDSFIRSYTWRPIASMYDMFGSEDLEYDEEGTVLSGVEGFHSKAFGQYENLFAFVEEDVREILGVTRNKKATYTMKDGTDYTTEMPVSARLDVRKRRQDKVLEYLAELEKKGILG